MHDVDLLLFIFSIFKFKDCSTGEDLVDELCHVKFSCMTWTHDEKGLFYNVCCVVISSICTGLLLIHCLSTKRKIIYIYIYTELPTYN